MKHSKQKLPAVPTVASPPATFAQWIAPSGIAMALVDSDGQILFATEELYGLWDRVGKLAGMDREGVQREFITALHAERGKRRWTSRILGTGSIPLCIEVVAGKSLRVEGQWAQLLFFLPMELAERHCEHPYLIGPLRVDADTGYVMWYRDYLDLTQSEFNVLLHLIRNADRPVDKRDLLKAVWGTRNATTRVMDITVSRLRRKFKKLGAPEGLIHTVHGTGYMFRAWLLAENTALSARPCGPPASGQPASV